MLRYLNMFVLTGIALIGISIAGFATHNRFLTEPGQTQNQYGSLIYLSAGFLMLVNGIVSVRTALPVNRQDASTATRNNKAAAE